MRIPWSSSKVLFIGYEPWETYLGLSLLESLKSEYNSTDTLLLVADPYQVANKNAALKLIRETRGSTTFIERVYSDLTTWQSQIQRAETEDVERRWRAMAQDFGLDRLDHCLKSDVVLFPYERTPYYPSMSEAQKKESALLVFDRVLKIFLDFKPDVVVMVGDQYLVKNFVGLLCEKHSIPIRVVRHSRFKSLYKCDGFFFPQVSGRSFQGDAEPDASQIFNGEYDQFLYPDNLAVGDKALLRKAREMPLSYSLIAIKTGIKKMALREHNYLKALVAGFILRDFSKIKFWKSSRLKVFFFSLQVMWRRAKYPWVRSVFRDVPEVPEYFVLVPLHYRPESSTLTAGFGTNDEVLIEEISSVLKEIAPEMVCFVLENPSMVGLRKPSFYRDLKKLGNVWLGNPVLDTQALIARSSAVLTVSGTAALEASLQDVPVFVSGRPDYLSAVNQEGYRDVKAFLRLVVERKAKTSRLAAIKYLRWVSAHGRQGALGWKSVRNDRTKGKSVRLLRDVLNMPLPGNASFGVN